jgi:hypothetical protein
MKAEITDDWEDLRTGTITLNTENGVPVAQIRFSCVNPELISMRNYHKEMYQLAQRLVAAINTKKE